MVSATGNHRGASRSFLGGVRLKRLVENYIMGESGDLKLIILQFVVVSLPVGW